MGDSYSSGEGIPGTNPGNPALQGQRDCERANGDGTDAKAWAVVAVEQLEALDNGYEYERPFFVACTGATVDGAATQLAEMQTGVTDPALQRWNVVSFSFGGNSIGFVDVILGCLDLNPFWGAFDLSPGCDVSIDQLRSRIDRLTGNKPISSGEYVGVEALPQLYDRVATVVAPGGHVLVVGYPNLVEEVSRWDRWRRQVLGNCEGIRDFDVGLLRSATGYLNQQTALAVEAADARWAPSGVRFDFVDISRAVYETSSASADRHALCSEDPWLNGVTLSITSGDFRKERSFHPQQTGHTATGGYLANLLADLDQFDFSAPDVMQTSLLSRLKGAPVPALCDHSPGNLVDGVLPDELLDADPSADSSGSVSLIDDPPPLEADLEGDGSSEIVAAVLCVEASYGGYPDAFQHLVVYDSALTLLGETAVDGLVTAVAAGDQGVEVSWTTCVDDVQVCLPDGQQHGLLRRTPNGVELVTDTDVIGAEDPTAVATEFLARVQAGDQAPAESLEVPGLLPTVYTWARDLGAFNDFAFWTSPTCTTDVDAASCWFIQGDPAPRLELVRHNGTWLISYPFYSDDDIDFTVVGSRCVIDTTPLNLRGGPGLQWPAFAQIPVGDCSVDATATVRTAKNGRPWRLVTWGTLTGWVSDLMLAPP